MTTLRGLARLRAIGPLRIVAVAIGAALILLVLLLDGLENSDRTATVVLALVSLLTIVGVLAPASTDTKSLDEVAPQLIEEIHGKWHLEADRRGFLAMRTFLPPSLGPGPSASTARGRATVPVTLEEFQDVILGEVTGSPGRRLMIYGEKGSGKTTIAILLTLGILARKQRPDGTGLPIPLLVSLSSWRPASDSLEAWLDRQLVLQYGSLRSFDASGFSSRAAALVHSGRFLFVLDGLDEVREAGRGATLSKIDAFFASDVAVVLLSRPSASIEPSLSFARDGALEGMTVRHLEEIPEDVAVHYLEAEGARRADSSIAELVEVLRRRGFGQMASLRRALHLDLVASLVRDSDGQVRQLVSRLREGRQAVDQTIIELELGTALERTGYPPRDAERWTSFLARAMTRQDALILPWWRLPELVDVRVLLTALSLAIAPSYWLATIMPVGLTRGLTIGVVAGITFGLLRGRRIGAVDAAFGAALAFSVVGLVGTLALGLRHGLVDATEIATAYFVTVHLRTRFVGGGRGAVLRCTLLTGAVVSAATSLVSAALRYDDPDRGPASIAMAGAFGVGIAAVSARAFWPSADSLAASTVILRSGRRRGGNARWFSNALVCPLAIGLGGGVGGGLRLGLEYGLMLTLMFSVVIGVPVGLAGGVFGWLSAPLDNKKWKAASTLRTDRAVAISCVAGIGAAASVAIWLFSGPLDAAAEVIDRESAFSINPYHGVFFGLTIGVIVACLITSWPAYLVATCWLGLRRRTPFRLATFLQRLHEVEILRWEGPYHRFRHEEYQEFFYKS